ncbi:MAG TPA: PIG-L family deacetylase [Roseiflexaceae bacterium]|nr:PIG-L family deacetylase [Roseiflexaceae bacterium]
MTTLPIDTAAYGIDSHWLTHGEAARRLLIVYAHPDDESFGNAGTILRYASAGVAVHYACATRGEAGTVAPEHLDGYPDTAALRTAEMLRAADTLGLAGVHFLGYRDSGMAGSPDNLHPDALVQAPRQRVAGQIVALIRALRPQVVLTFGPYGGYGHPDHIAIHHATLAAFEQAGDPAHFPEHQDAGLVPWSPARLYYSTFRVALAGPALALMWLFGRDPRRFGQNGDVDLLRAVGMVTPVTTVVDSAAFLEAKERAWACHASQGGGRERVGRLPVFVRRRLSAAERFTRVVPQWEGNGLERDLFAGL